MKRTESTGSPSHADTVAARRSAAGAGGRTAAHSTGRSRTTAAPPDREAAIVAAARGIAETEGWSAVTVRRLAAAIGYSQPVLYQHFPQGRPEIIAAVARTGFAQLEGLVSTGAADGTSAVAETARAYLAFAREHAALYTAMFEMPSLNRFASVQTPVELRNAFDALVALLGSGPGADTRTELFWSMLHGVAVLERDGRLPPEQREERIAQIAQLFS